MGPGDGSVEDALQPAGDLASGRKGEQVDVFGEPEVDQVGAGQGGPAEEDQVLRVAAGRQRGEQDRDEVVPMDLLLGNAEPLDVVGQLAAREPRGERAGRAVHVATCRRRASAAPIR